MRTLYTALMVAMLVLAMTPILAADYVVIKEKDSSFGNNRSRITIEIEAPLASTDRQRLDAMMAAAMDRHRKDWPDAVSARLWNSYENDSSIRNRISYAPDGCGWTGDDCTGDIWTDLFRGEIPVDLANWGSPTEAEAEAGKDLACRQDLQCWGEKHIADVEITCASLIERMAKYDHEWTDGWLERKIDRWQWKDRDAGSVSYRGDKVKFQNGFGAWQPMSYWCHYDHAASTVQAKVFARQ